MGSRILRGTSNMTKRLGFGADTGAQKIFISDVRFIFWTSFLPVSFLFDFRYDPYATLNMPPTPSKGTLK